MLMVLQPVCPWVNFKGLADRSLKVTTIAQLAGKQYGIAVVALRQQVSMLSFPFIAGLASISRGHSSGGDS